VIQWKINVEPGIGQRRPCLLFDRDGRGILGSICGNKLSLGWSVANENALVAPPDAAENMLGKSNSRKAPQSLQLIV